MTRIAALIAALGAAAMLASLAACGGTDADDVGVTDDMTDAGAALETGPQSGADMDLDEADLDRPGGGLTEAFDSDAAGDVVATAERDGRFVTLLAAVEAAGLTDTLRRGEYTLFAPTDAAFERLGGEAVGQLLQPENRDQLVTILQYHLLENPVMSSDIDGVIEAPTLAGDGLTVERVGDRVQVGGEGGAVVTDADIGATNGVIHVIDSVLIPPAG